MRFVLLMYTEPARTRTMTAAEQAEIKQKYEELGTELLASGELRNGCGMAFPAETRPSPPPRILSVGPDPATPADRRRLVAECRHVPLR